MKSLFIPLKTEYFQAFKSRKKRTEYRLFGPRWNKKTCFPGRPATLSHGYSGERLHGTVRSTRIIRNTVTDIYPSNARLIAIGIDIE